MPATTVDLVRLGPNYYIHVLDNNSHVSRVEVGPQTVTRREHETIVFGPEKCTVVPPQHFVKIKNPVERDAAGEVVVDKHGQAKLRYGQFEIRHDLSEPFPLFPGEEIVSPVTAMQVLPHGHAFRLRATCNFVDRVREREREREGEKEGDGSKGRGEVVCGDGTGAYVDIQRTAGDEWLFLGPGVYTPHVDVEIAQEFSSTVIKANQALRLRARRDTKDFTGKLRRAGEEWLVRRVGEYLPQVDEELICTVDAYILTANVALHLKAERTYEDVFGKMRKAGEEWLVTIEEAETHVPDVYESVIGEVPIISLSPRQYCVVVDPVDRETGKPQLGQREVRKGELSFFLRPGERLEAGIQDVYVLPEDTALLVTANMGFVESGEDKGAGEEKAPLIHRRPGDRWMIHGPTDYIPRIEVEILERREFIPLNENEGVYVRDLRTGKVRAVIGRSYMLEPHEELWEKVLPTAVEELLAMDKDPLSDRNSQAKGGQRKGEKGPRDRTRVVTFRAPHNSAVQVYDYTNKTTRIVFGPDLVMLQPDEQFTVLSLSGGKPKSPGQIRSLALLLGPDFMTDVINVETCDHARLQLQLSYNWHFDVDVAGAAAKTKGAREGEREGGKGDKVAEAAKQVFMVPDFVGDACKAIASRIRGAVAVETFDQFHKQSAKIIRKSVFGVDESGKVRESFCFTMNRLVITNIDIQSVEPIDRQTRDSLQKSVQLAIEITTKSQEAAARHEAERVEQEAKGRLERQRLSDQADGESFRQRLLELQAESAAVESTGLAKAEAKARAEAAKIESAGDVDQAKLKAEARRIELEAEFALEDRKRLAEFEHRKRMNDLDLTHSRELAVIETEKFRAQIDAIGQSTLVEMARAGPEAQAKLLQGLGLQGYMITDGKSPINLFQTAEGMVKHNAQQQ